MIRALFIILAVLVAVLAYLMGYGWLYLVAGLLVLAALGLLALDWQRAQRKAERPYTGTSAAREDDLSSLGIMEIREKQTPSERNRAEENHAAKQPAGAVGAVRKQPPKAHPASGPSPDATPRAADPAKKQAPKEDEHAGNVTVAPTPEPPAPDESVPDASEHDASEHDEQLLPDEQVSDEQEELGDEPDPVLAPYLEALRAALGARTAALLVQEEVALTYRIEALAGRPARTRSRGQVFSTEQPLLTASMARRPVTMLRAGEDDGLPDRLGYYRAPASPPAFIALAPVPRRDAPTNHFLVADAAAEGFKDRPEALMERFATLLSFMLNASEVPLLADPELPETSVPPSAQHAAGDGAAHPAPDQPAQSEPAQSEPAQSESATEASAARPGRAGQEPAGREGTEREGARGESAEEDQARPRRDIIAEEIDRARAAGQPLALALVYLNRAEAVAERGAVEQGERALRARLESAAPESRIEPFGELAYGLFHRGPHAGVEDWAMDVQRALTEAGGALDGGVSIGIALLTDDLDDPEALRKHATRALHEAYTTGTCTILE